MIDADDGRVVKFVGDGCLAVFEPTDAVRAVDATEALRTRVRELGAANGVELDLGANIHLSTVAEGAFGLRGIHDVVGMGVVHTFRMGGGAGIRISEPVYRKLPSDAAHRGESTSRPRNLRRGAVMAALPSGLVAFLMTDVVGSSKAWNERPSDTEEAIVALDADIGSIVDDRGGAVVKARLARATATSRSSPRRRGRSSPPQIFRGASIDDSAYAPASS